METKPYRIQSPEGIAKDYGGNKQKIAEAMQMGVVDPTAGVLAGMFIDRMRSAQMQETAPQPSVAQQVMGGAPAQAPLAPAGGLGATPPALPPMAPEGGIGAPPMEAPMAEEEPMMEEAPMGMAAGGLYAPPYTQGGGLGDLPIPDTMFDENRDGGYANGGIVAFSDGGPTGGMSNLYNSVEYWESRGKQGAVSPKGARGVMQLMPGTMRDPGFGVTPMQADTEEENRRVGQEYLDAMYRKYGDQATALAAYNWGPGNVDKWLKRGGDPKKLPSETKKYISNVMKGTEPPMRERDLSKPQGQVGALEDYMRVAERYTKPEETELAGEEKLRARFQEMGSDEYYEKQRKDSMWEALAMLGANMASSKAPNLLQAIGEATVATLPGIKADKKERKELKDRALEGLANLGIRDRKRRLEALEVGMNLYKTGIEAQQFDQRLNLQERQIQDEKDYRDAMLGIERYKAENPNASDLETKVGWAIQQGLAKDPVSAMIYLQQNSLLGGQQGASTGNAAADARAALGEGRDGTGPWKQYQ
jgi:hypothetical protein